MIFKDEKDRRSAYRNTFSSNEGRMVLVDILDSLYFWDTIQRPNISGEERNALSLAANRILHSCMRQGQDDYAEYSRIAWAFLNITPKEVKKTWFERMRKWLKWRK